ncbi:MAG: ABC transporter permease [Anaerolineales bacterium]
MIRFVSRRLAYGLITLLATSIIVFVMSEVVPVDPARSILGQYTTAENVRQLRLKMGLDRPLVERYVTWLSKTVRGDLGESFRLGVPIQPLLLARLRNSLYLALLGLIILIPVSLLSGVVSGLTEGRWPDIAISVFSLFTTSLPEFVSGILLIIVFAWWLKILPGNSLPGGEDGNVLAQPVILILPALTLALSQYGYVTRITRVSMSRVMRSAYIRTAVLKGLPLRTVIFRHALRNALLAPITVITTNLGFMVGGLIIIESVFSYPGLGRLFAGAAVFNDIPMLEASAMLGVILAVGSQLLADILYGYLNPLIRYS